MTWDITNNNYDGWHIKFNNGWQVIYVPKGRIYMEVEEPYLTIYWTDTELGSEGINRNLVIDFNDVTPSVASAADLKVLIDGYNVAPSAGVTVAASASNGSFTFNTLNFGALNGLTFYTSNSSIVGSYTVPAGGSPIFSAGASSASLGSIVFSNSNGIGFGLNGSTITASHNGLTTQTVQPAIGLNTAQTNVTWTVNSSGISFDAGAYLTSQSVQPAVGLNTAQTNVTWTVNSSGISINAGAYLTTARASNDGIGLNTAQTNVTWTVNSSGISLNAGAYLTTARASTDAIGLNTAQTNVTWTVNSSGISLNAGAYLTTARRSTDGIGLNTAGTNITWTANSSGISINASGYAGIGTSATNASITLNSNGLAISVAAPGGGAAPVFSGGTSSASLSSIVFSNSNGVSFGLNGSTMTASVNAGGAGAAMSKFPYEPLYASAVLTIASGTIGTTGGSTQVSGIGYLNFMPVPNNIEFRDLVVVHTVNTIAGTGSVSLGNMLGIYSLNGNTVLSLVSSFQNVINISQNSVSAKSFHYYWGTNSNANSTSLGGNISASMTGFRWMYLNQSEQTLAAGNYYFAYMHTANTTGSYIHNMSTVLLNPVNNSAFNLPFGNNVISNPGAQWNGVFSTTTNNSAMGLPVMPTTIHTSRISGTNNVSQQRPIYFVMQRNSTT